MNFKQAGILFSLILAFSGITAQQLKLVLPIGHTRGNGINKQQFTPDGKYVITSSEDMTVKIWDVSSGKLIQNFKGHTGLVAAVEFKCSPGGTNIAIPAGDGVFRIWNILNGNLDFSFDLGNISLATWGFDNNDTTLFLLDKSGQAWHFSPHVKKLLYTLPGYKVDPVTEAFLSHNLKYLAVNKKNGPLTLFEKKTGRKIKDLPGSMRKEAIETLLFSPADSFLCAGYFDNSIHIWDTKTFKHKGLDSIYKANFSSLIAFSKREHIIAFVSVSEEVLICQLPDLSIKQIIPPVEEGIDQLQFCGSQNKLLISGFDSTLTVWDFEGGIPLYQFKDFGDSPHSLDYNETSDYFLAGIWNKTIGIWRADNYQPIQFLKGSSSTIMAHEVDPSKKMVAVAGDDGIARVWDIVNGKINIAFKAHTQDLTQISYFKDGKQLLTGSLDGTVKTWDLAQKKLILSLSGHDGGVKSASLFKKDSLILTLAHYQRGLPRGWDSKNGKLLFNIPSGNEFIESAAYCLDDKFMYFISLGKNNNSYFRLWDAVTMKELVKFEAYQGYFRDPHFDSTGTRVLLSGVGNNVWILDLKTGKLAVTINTGENWLMDAEFRDHDKKVVSRERYGAIKIWDSFTGKLLDSFQVNADDLLYYRMNNEASRMLLIDKSRKVTELEITGRKIKSQPSINLRGYSFTDRVLFISDEAELLMFNLLSGKFIASYINVDTDGGLVLLPGGYYFGDKNSTKKLHYVKDGKIITFDQLDIKFNRPDIVLAAIGNSDTALLRSYRKAWEKRIKKLGIDTTFFREDYSVPETEFEDRKRIGYDQKEKMSLHIKSSDKRYTLDRFNVWINEVPLYGQRGISLKDRKISSFDTVLAIKLGQGKNIIEASVTNVNGVESYREPLTVYYTPTSPKHETTHFIGIGIDRFSDSQYNLQYSAKDIRDLAVKLKEKYGAGIIIDTLFNENVTAQKVRSLKQQLLNTTINDKVILAYSGHGLLNKDFDYYLSTYDINFDRPEEKGLSYNELENMLDSIPARKKLMLIDACHSGEVDKDDLVRLDSSPDSLIKGLRPVAFKKDENHFGLKNSFELMQNLFVNVGKSTGAVVISAAAGTQFALERNDLKNGVFTYCILEAMEKYPVMKVSELKKIVGEKVEQLTNGLQKPTYRNETIAVDWNVW